MNFTLIVSLGITESTVRLTKSKEGASESYGELKKGSTAKLGGKVILHTNLNKNWRES